MHLNRRDLLRTGAFAAAASPFALPVLHASQEQKSANERPRFGMIGCGDLGTKHHGSNVKKLGDFIAMADVDAERVQNFNKLHCEGKGKTYEDYRKVLDHKEIDAVFVVTPDHWHVKIAADAMRAGKDVYCEKPLTLTVDEGRFLIEVAKQTGKILQVGTQQRSDTKFQTAVALAQSGRLGKISKAIVAIGGGPKGGPFAKSEPPKTLNFDMWLGQAPKVQYIKERVHYQFRWWYEYSGGKLTDWGAHHVDIAQWAIAPDGSGPVSIEPIKLTHPVAFKDGFPTEDDKYNTLITFQIRAMFANGVEMIICDKSDELKFDNGVYLIGDKGSLFVNRGKLEGSAVEELKKNPLPEEVMTKLRGGRKVMNHWQNFLEACRDRKAPISDIESHVRHLNTCHLAGIAARLNRKIQWDAAAGRILGDDQANSFLKREARKGYEVV